ncbi:MAG TPA: hypothetical protein ENI23_18030 [bacterium]|nr:hypothetical protein [bacterium]
MVSYDFQRYSPWISMWNTNDFKRDAPGTSSTNIDVTTCPYAYETVRVHLNDASAGTYTADWYWPNGTLMFTYSVTLTGAGGWARWWVGVLASEINQTGTYRVHLSGPGVNHDINFTIFGTVAGAGFTGDTGFKKFNPEIPHSYTHSQHWAASVIAWTSKDYDLVPMSENYDTFNYEWHIFKGPTSYGVNVYCRIRDPDGVEIYTITWGITPSQENAWSRDWVAHSSSQLKDVGLHDIYYRIYRVDTNQTLSEVFEEFTVSSSDPSSYRLNIPSIRRAVVKTGYQLNIA